MKYFTFGVLLFFGFGVTGQEVVPNEENPKTLTFDFGCAVEVDLKIYSVHSSTPVSDAEEFTSGARGIESEDENDFIKVEFLEISGVTSGPVTLTFELKYSLNGEYYIWDENFNTLLGTVTNTNDILEIEIDASQLPYNVKLQTSSKSQTYRDIFVQMDYDGVKDKARATVYQENTNSAIEIKSLDANISSHQWTPTNPYSGSNSFISNISDGLDFIYANNLANYQLTSTIGGHIIDDFLGSGVLSFADVLISEEEWGNTIMSTDGSQLLMSNGQGALKIFEETNGMVLQEEGYIPPFVFVIHELAHIWLQKYDPFLDDAFSTTDNSVKMSLYPVLGYLVIIILTPLNMTLF